MTTRPITLHERELSARTRILSQCPAGLHTVVDKLNRKPISYIMDKSIVCTIKRNSSCHKPFGVSGGLGELGFGGGPSQPPQAQQPSFQDPFGAPAPSPSNAPQQAPLPTLLPADKGKGLTLRGQIVRMDGRIGRHVVVPMSQVQDLST